MAKVLTGISGNVISAASAAFAPTNSADVSAIASAYQVVSATGTQLYAGTAYVTSVNEAPLSASRAGNAANASMATSAYYDGTGRLISALPDSAAVSAIASAYAESAASGKQDALTFSYDDDKISAINGSALAGQGGGSGSVVSPSGTITVTDGSSLEATNSAIGTAEGLDVNNSGQANISVYPSSYEYLGSYSTFKARGIGLTYNSSTATRTAWVSANTNLGNLVSSFVLPASSISAGGLLSTSNIDSVWDSQLKVDGGSLTLSGSYPVLFVYPGIPYSVVKELAWKDDIPDPINIGVYENIYHDKYVSSIDSIPVSAKWAGSANYTYTAAQDPNGRNLTALAAKTSIPTEVTSPNGTIITNGFNVEATNSAVTTTIVPGYDTTVVGWAYELSPSTPIVCTLPSANENSKLFFPLNYGGTIVVSAVYNGITATTSVDGSNTANVVFKVPNATTVSLYGSFYRSLSGSASASAADYLAPGGVGELAWASAIPTYSYDAEDKISAINGSAIAGGGGGGGVDSATVSAIASSYAESAASSKLDTTAYNSADFYSTSNPSGFIDSAYVDSAVSGKADASALSGYYTTANESGFLTAQAQASWSESASASPSYIQDKPDLVDIVAGPGIVVDNPDGNTLRVSTDENYETVLWSGDTGMIIGSSSGSCSLSESAFNFEKIGIYAQGSVVACIELHCFEIGTSPMTFGLVVSQYESNETIFNDACVIGLTGSTLSYSNGSRTELKTAIAHRNDRGPKIVKIVGIHRINGGN